MPPAVLDSGLIVLIVAAVAIAAVVTTPDKKIDSLQYPPISGPRVGR